MSLAVVRDLRLEMFDKLQEPLCRQRARIGGHRHGISLAGFDETAGVSTITIRWVGVAIDCADAGPVARFYERLLG